MKTRIFSAALAAALVPALAACAAGGPASRGEASAGTATPQSAAADPAEAGSLQPLTPGTGQGYYVCGSNGGSPLLCYLDYALAAEGAAVRPPQLRAQQRKLHRLAARRTDGSAT